MMLAIFAILAASGVEFLSNLDQIRSGDITLLPILTGAVTSLVIGIPSLKWLIAAARGARFRPFALYCYTLAIFAFVVGMY